MLACDETVRRRSLPCDPWRCIYRSGSDFFSSLGRLAKHVVFFYLLLGQHMNIWREGWLSQCYPNDNFCRHCSNAHAANGLLIRNMNSTLCMYFQSNKRVSSGQSLWLPVVTETYRGMPTCCKLGMRNWYCLIALVVALLLRSRQLCIMLAQCYTSLLTTGYKKQSSTQDYTILYALPTGCTIQLILLTYRSA